MDIVKERTADLSEDEKLTVVNVGSSYELYYSDNEKYGTVVEQDGSAVFVEE